MFKKLSVVAIMFIIVNLQAKAAQPNVCQKTVERCNHQLQGISNAISNQTDDDTIMKLEDLLEEKKMRCAEYIQEACSQIINKGLVMKVLNSLLIIMSFILISCGGGSEGGGGAAGVSTTNDGFEQSTSSVKVQYIDTDIYNTKHRLSGVLSLQIVFYLDGFMTTQYQHNPEGWDLVRLGFDGQEKFGIDFPIDFVDADVFKEYRFLKLQTDNEGNSIVVVVALLNRPEQGSCCSYSEYYGFVFDSNGIEIGRVRLDDPLENDNELLVVTREIQFRNGVFYIIGNLRIYMVDTNATFLGNIDLSEEQVNDQYLNFNLNNMTLWSYFTDPSSMAIHSDGSVTVNIKTHNHYGDYSTYIRHYEMNGTLISERHLYYFKGSNDSWLPYHNGPNGPVGVHLDHSERQLFIFERQNGSSSEKDFMVRKYALTGSSFTTPINFPKVHGVGFANKFTLSNGDLLIVGNKSGKFSPRRVKMTSAGNLIVFATVSAINDSELGNSGSSEFGIMTISKAYLDSLSDPFKDHAAKIDRSITPIPALFDFGSGNLSDLYQFTCSNSNQYRQTIHYTSPSCLDAKKFYTKTMNCSESHNFLAAFELCESACGSSICEE